MHCCNSHTNSFSSIIFVFSPRKLKLSKQNEIFFCLWQYISLMIRVLKVIVKVCMYIYMHVIVIDMYLSLFRWHKEQESDEGTKGDV